MASHEQGRLFASDEPPEEAEGAAAPQPSVVSRQLSAKPKRRPRAKPAPTFDDEEAEGPVESGEAPWITVAELARCLSTTSNAVRQWLGELPAELKRNVGHKRRVKWELKGKETVLWWAEHKAGLAGSLQPAAVSGQSERDPIDERLRELKLQQAELEMAKQLGQLVPREAQRQWLGGLAQLLRQMSDHLVKKYGNEAGLVVESYLQSFEAELAGREPGT